MTTTISRYSLYILLLTVFSFAGCKKPPIYTHGDNTFAVTAEDDKKIGQAIDGEFIKYIDTASHISLYERDHHQELYSILDDLIQKAVSTNQLANGILFDWTIRIIDEPNNEHIFVAPGGYIYVTKDILMLLNSEAQLFMLISHAMANIDKRYITEQLEDNLSIRYLEDLALGGTVEDMTDIFYTIQHAKYDSADVHVIEEQAKAITCAKKYDLGSYADFITQITQVIKEPIEWAIAYPADPNRVSEIYNHQKDTECSGNTVGLEFYKKFIALL
ncbi:MAG: hypothetical protein GY810_18425 [Aureispira sp.]|nr:hypothetical protein [Aureispira sp.]